jgi:uncharacterized protein (DUF1800 family)
VTASQSALIAHLYRRAAFGATASELDVAMTKGFDSCVDELLSGLSASATPPAGAPKLTSMADSRSNPNLYDEFMELVNWWVDQMVTTPTPLLEKVVLLLHCQFPTAISKVGWPSMMQAQNSIFREHGTGAFDELVQLVAKDPAMLIWLDTGSDQKMNPNENFARELMERFTMGIGNYSQADVREGARCFAGWSLDYQTAQFSYAEWAADLGWKSFLGQSGALTGEDVVDIVTHDPACAPFITSRLWSWLAYPVTPADPVVAELAPGFAADLDLSKLVASMLRHRAFVSDQAVGGLIKQPAEYLVGTMRRFGLTTKQFQNQGVIDSYLAGLGQELFNPPNVGGWGQNSYWLSTATSLIRLQLAYEIAQSADISSLEQLPVGERVEWLGAVLGVEKWSNTTVRALGHQIDDPVNLLALALVAPEYCVN